MDLRSVLPSECTLQSHLAIVLPSNAIIELELAFWSMTSVVKLIYSISTTTLSLIELLRACLCVCTCELQREVGGLFVLYQWTVQKKSGFSFDGICFNFLSNHSLSCCEDVWPVEYVWLNLFVCTVCSALCVYPHTPQTADCQIEGNYNYQVLGIQLCWNSEEDVERAQHCLACTRLNFYWAERGSWRRTGTLDSLPLTWSEGCNVSSGLLSGINGWMDGIDMPED